MRLFLLFLPLFAFIQCQSPTDFVFAKKSWSESAKMALMCVDPASPIDMVLDTNEYQNQVPITAKVYTTPCRVSALELEEKDMLGSQVFVQQNVTCETLTGPWVLSEGWVLFSIAGVKKFVKVPCLLRPGANPGTLKAVKREVRINTADYGKELLVQL